MKIDVYTKVVLTLIAIALWGILVKPLFVPKAKASSEYVSVVGTVHVDIAQVAGKQLSMFSPAVPVEVVK